QPLAGPLAVAMDVHGEPLAEDAAQPIEVQSRLGPRERPLGAAREAEEAARVLLDLLPPRRGRALLAPEGGVGEQAAEVPVAGAALDQEPDEPDALDHHLGADERSHPGLPCREEEARRGVEAAPVRERERVVAERRRALDEILRQ